MQDMEQRREAQYYRQKNFHNKRGMPMRAPSSSNEGECDVNEVLADISFAAQVRQIKTRAAPEHFEGAGLGKRNLWVKPRKDA